MPSPRTSKPVWRSAAAHRSKAKPGKRSHRIPAEKFKEVGDEVARYILGVDSDFEQGGSDALIDALIAWGSPDKIRAHIEAHFKAGADHVCIQPLRPDGAQGPDLALLEALKPT